MGAEEISPTKLQSLASSIQQFSESATIQQIQPQAVTAVQAALEALFSAVAAAVPPVALQNQGSQSSSSKDGLTAQSKLSEFYERWFVPHVIEMRELSINTVLKYEETMHWWIFLTGDPPLEAIEQLMLAHFTQALRTAKYKRGQFGIEPPLSSFSQRGHLVRLRAILTRVGPTYHPRFPAAHILNRTPYFEIRDKPFCKPKRPFTIEQARAIYDACKQMKWENYGRGLAKKLGRKPPDFPAADFWRALILTLFYTGLRIGDVLRLQWHMFTSNEGQRYVETTAKKTGKFKMQFVHPLAFAAMERIRLPDSMRVFTWPFCYTHLDHLHFRLQKAAKLPVQDRLSLQAWRRTHGVEIARLGFSSAMQLAQQALDHGDVQTTKNHYVNLMSDFILQLPRIDRWVDTPTRTKESSISKPRPVWARNDGRKTA